MKIVGGILGTITVICILCFWFVVIGGKDSIGSYSRTESSLRNQNNNVVTFDGSIAQKYVNVMMQCEDGVDGGLGYRVINPRGQVVKVGRLNGTEILRDKFDSIEGEWKIVYDIKAEQEVMIATGVSVNSTGENKMKVQSDK